MSDQELWRGKGEPLVDSVVGGAHRNESVCELIDKVSAKKVNSVIKSEFGGAKMIYRPLL